MGQIAVLERANKIRLGRASLHQRVARGNVQLACELLLTRDERIKSMTIGDFIEWLPKVGPTRAEGIMRRAFEWYADSTPGRLVGSLGEQTCLVLTAEIRSTLGVA